MTPTMTDEEPFVTAEDGDFADSDFTAIEAAVMETSRGRWFLREYARRNRHADTEVVLGAVNRLQDDTLPGRAVRVMDHLHDNLRTIATMFEQTRREVALLPPVDRVGLHPIHPDVPLSDTDAAGMQRIARILKNLRYLETRLHAMIAICDSEPAESEPMRQPEPTAAHPPFLM
ncbi:hypothetical protein [Microvirga brassicacearum]|uniref:Uncharacterized protein n=1 Tax=Microvirga brassicacearum TaxID=2580413 RepID=A0A5N3PB04_9HYPH|nr:hypothetical protein FEZ63_10900 [Microvirga brassicacearum]